jgi:hypothetical protein
MTGDGLDALVRRAVGGDADAAASIAAGSDVSADATVLTVAALLGSLPSRLDRAALLALSRRDRQMVAIASAHLGGDADLVDALARDHLVDFPDSYVVAWIASGAVIPAADGEPH